ncbi:MAG: TIGR03842 family LLM class F420-dependent oxidoreductase, partial [Proteobacteria bacterium]|nr:TIGR03842 family LLM class F420-dependent oxidoreductase [Pseudomonadota bacterium]
DEVVDRFCVIGSAAQVREKLAHLEEIGVDQFNLYLMNGNEHSTLDAFGRDIIPNMRGATASA